MFHEEFGQVKFHFLLSIVGLQWSLVDVKAIFCLEHLAKFIDLGNGQHDSHLS